MRLLAAISLCVQALVVATSNNFAAVSRERRKVYVPFGVYVLSTGDSGPRPTGDNNVLDSFEARVTGIGIQNVDSSNFRLPNEDDDEIVLRSAISADGKTLLEECGIDTLEDETVDREVVFESIADVDRGITGLIVVSSIFFLDNCVLCRVSYVC
jgi:hypothetical protein